MKMECPGCGKTLVIKPEHAGKTGKCPGCGHVVTLPASNADIDTEDDSPGAAGDREEAGAEVVFSGDKETAGTPFGRPSRSSKMTVIVGLIIAAVLIGVGAVWYVTSPARIKLPEISFYNTDSDRYVKRSVSLKPEEIAAWQKTIRKVTGDYYTSKEIFFILPNIDSLWKEDAYNAETAGKVLGRLEKMPLHVLRDWRTSLKRATGGTVGNRLSDAAFRIIEIDRMFNGDTVDTGVSDTLLTRMNAVSSEDFFRWAEALDIEIGQAALVLVLTDSFFDDGIFQQKRFEKKMSYEAGK